MTVQLKVGGLYATAKDRGIVVRVEDFVHGRYNCLLLASKHPVEVGLIAHWYAGGSFLRSPGTSEDLIREITP